MPHERSELFVWLEPQRRHKTEISRNISAVNLTKELTGIKTKSISSTIKNLPNNDNLAKFKEDNSPTKSELIRPPIRNTSSNVMVHYERKKQLTRSKTVGLVANSGINSKLTSLFCNPSLFRCSDDFVLLPLSTKVKMARRATFSNSLWQKLVNNHNAWTPETLQQIISLPEIVQPDHVGWLTDILDHNEKCWCVVADIFMCVFENFQSQKARKVIMLSGSLVKAVVFRSASLSSISFNSSLDHMTSRSSIFILGDMNLDMYQFFIENEITGEKQKFSALSQESLDKWVSVLKATSFLNTDIYVANLPLGIFPHTIINKDASWSPASSEGRNTQYSNETGYKSRSDSSISDHQDLEECRLSIDLYSNDADYIHKQHCLNGLSKHKEESRESSSNETIGKSLGAKIVRTASGLKQRIRQKTKSFSNSKKVYGNLSQNDISGYLYCRGLIKWTKLWCLVKEKVFYGFKSRMNTEVADILFPLEDFKIIILADDKNHNTFKLCRAKTKSVVLKARDAWDFERWLDFFRLRGVEVIDNFMQNSDNNYDWLERLSQPIEATYSQGGNEEDESRSVSSCTASVNLLRLDPSDSSCSNADNSSMEGSIDFCESGCVNNHLINNQSLNNNNQEFSKRLSSPPHTKRKWKSERDISGEYISSFRSRCLPQSLDNVQEDVMNSETGSMKHCGWMYIYSGNKVWQRYFVTLQKRILRWHNSQEETQPQGVINMAECDCEISAFEDVQHVLKVTPKNSGTPMYLYANTEVDTEQWLQRVEVHTPTYNKLQLESLNLECNNIDQYKNNQEVCQQWKDKILRDQRLKLLEEVLQVKTELQMKKQQKALVHRMNEADIAIKYQRALTEEEQKALRLGTYLRLRRISTQLKVESLKKQLQNKNKNRFGKSKIPQDVDTIMSENHLLELTEKLSEIDQKLQSNEKQKNELRKALETKREKEIQLLKCQSCFQNNLNIRTVTRSPSLKVTGEIQRSKIDIPINFAQPTVSNVPPKNGKKTFEDWKKRGALKLFSDFRIKTGIQKRIKSSTSLSDLQLTNNFNQRTLSNLELPVLAENEAYRACSARDHNSFDYVHHPEVVSNIIDKEQHNLTEAEKMETEIDKSSESKGKKEEEISPNVMAQIEEFELMVQNYLSMSVSN